MKVIKILSNSANLMKLLNSAILNLYLIKRLNFHPNMVSVRQPTSVLRQFVCYF